MSAVCIIPARAGSKRIPGKNTRDFLGSPILDRVIGTVQESGLFAAIVLSTDDPVAAGIAERRHITVLPRPATLCDDYATTAQVVEHALWHHDIHDHACTVYPTSVFLTPEILKQGFDLLLRHRHNVFAATPYPASPLQAFRSDWRMVFPDHRDTRTQDIETWYYDTGLMYWVEMERFLREKDLYGPGLAAIIVRNVVDINTEEDWRLAEVIYKGMRDD